MERDTNSEYLKPFLKRYNGPTLALHILTFYSIIQRPLTLPAPLKRKNLKVSTSKRWIRIKDLDYKNKNLKHKIFL